MWPAMSQGGEHRTSLATLLMETYAEASNIGPLGSTSTLGANTTDSVEAFSFVLAPFAQTSLPVYRQSRNTYRGRRVHLREQLHHMLECAAVALGKPDGEVLESHKLLCVRFTKVSFKPSR